MARLAPPPRKRVAPYHWLLKIDPDRWGHAAASKLPRTLSAINAGIPAGVVRATEINKAGKTVPADGKGMLYGLSLARDLNLSSDEQIRHAVAVLASAQGVVRSAYKDLVAAANPQSATQAAASANGPVPAYLTNQISNYQAALDRLTGGSDQSSGATGLSLLGF